jgi:predicted RNA methylase
MERLLGADLGDVRKISKLNVVISEHLMDATLMEAFIEVIGDVMDTIRKDVEATARRAQELEAAASAA